MPANAASRPVTNLLFVGHLSYPPNVEAVRFLMREIWPRLRSEFPDLRLTIAGRSPKRRLVGWARGDARIRLHADPEDLKPLYDRCDAVIVPLRSGGGSRIKVLEALACAKPVIASGKAVEGLDLEDGVHWLRAENPADYADAVRRLRSVPEVARELTTSGRRLVEERHTTAVIAENLKAVVDNLLRFHS